MKRTAAVCLLVGMLFGAGTGCGDDEPDAAPECAAIEAKVAALDAGSVDAWEDLASHLRSVAEDAHAVADGLRALPVGSIAADESFDEAEDVLAALNGPVDRVRDDLRSACGVELTNPFATPNG